MNLNEMVRSATEAFDLDEHRETFRPLIDKIVVAIVTATVAHLEAEGMMSDSACSFCRAHDLACPSCDADEFTKCECDRCGAPFICDNCDEEVSDD